MKSIKERGGIILVQDPGEAEFGEMPRSAIGTGLADFVLPAAQIGPKLAELVDSGGRITGQPRETDEKAFSRDVGLDRARRLRSMAEVQALLSRTQWTGANLRTILDTELRPYLQSQNVAISGADIPLKPEAAQSISLVIHELATNAAKHGALSQASGKVECVISVVRRGDADHLQLLWHESDGPPVKEPSRRSYGLHVIEELLAYETGAEVELDFAKEGLQCRITMPLAAVRSAGRGPFGE